MVLCAGVHGFGTMSTLRGERIWHHEPGVGSVGR